VPDALVVSPEAPYPLAGGGAMRTASILEYLARRYTLDIILFREPGAPDPRSSFPAGMARNVHTIDLPYHSQRFHVRASRNLVRFLYGRPPLNDRFGGFQEDFSRCLAGRRYDLAVVEHFWCAPYWEQVAPHAARTVLDLHNVESVLYRRLGALARPAESLLFSRFAAAARRMEHRWIPRFSSVLVTSDQDAARVGDIAPGAAIWLYPNAIPATSQPRVAEEEVVIFSGSLGYQPNISAVRFFRNEIWPVLRNRWPSLRWRLVGKNAEAVATYIKGDSRIETTGPVENAVEALAAARVVAAPLLAGSGTRMKIIEAWAAGRAVVSTAIGAEGLPARDGKHLLVADSATSFADAVSRLLESSEQRRRIGAAGRALYEQQFTWNRAWDVLAQHGI
jgi:glycosyltransferase involved in cell wall biosynthesis